MSVPIIGLAEAGCRARTSSRLAFIMQIREEIVNGRQSLDDVSEIIQTPGLSNVKIHFLMDALTARTEKQVQWNSFVRTPENNVRIGCLLIDLFYGHYATIVRGHKEHYYGEIEQMFRDWFVGRSFVRMYQYASEDAILRKFEEYKQGAGKERIEQIDLLKASIIARH